MKGLNAYLSIGFFAIVLPSLALGLQPANNTSGLSQPAVPSRVRTFSTGTDARGNTHQVTFDTHANGVIKCLSATGNNPTNYPPNCNVSGTPLPKDQTLGTQAGSATLTCDGQALTHCSIR